MYQYSERSPIQKFEPELMNTRGAPMSPNDDRSVRAQAPNWNVYQKCEGVQRAGLSCRRNCAGSPWTEGQNSSRSKSSRRSLRQSPAAAQKPQPICTAWERSSKRGATIRARAPTSPQANCCAAPRRGQGPQNWEQQTVHALR